MSPRSPTPARRYALAATLLLVGWAAYDVSPAQAQRSPVVEEGVELVRDHASYRFKRWLRERLLDDRAHAKYGLRYDQPWDQCHPSLPLIVQVHGYNSAYSRNIGIMEPFEAAGYPCAGFDYPNDHSIADSARRLSAELKRLARQQPDRRVVLVTHSMGGLVARACLEDARLDPGNVDRLMMIAPPTHGTLVAHLAIATDVWEHWLNRDSGGAWMRWRDSVVDGLGEAADDLVPDSDFLAQLNARPRNPNVTYSIFLGTAAAMQQEEMDWLRKRLQETGGQMPGLRDFAGRMDGLLEDLEELVDGKGDGIVAVKRGRLAGVDDIVLLPFGHLSVTGAAESDVVRQVQQELFARLQ